jgi:phosphate:Na+ symporter
MSLMTDGLKAIAGNAIRGSLARFTKGPVSGAITGAVTTGIVQSSSATTVMAVGFVGAGLMTFEQSLGIILGANVGSTVTGWLVAVIGVKLDLARIALPLILIGAIMRLLWRGRVTSIGASLAGFGLLFFGISLLQTGMAGFAETVTPSSFPPNTLWGRLQLVVLGIAITLIMQSSGAGVAMAVTAIHAGSISLDQAASLVIGMDVGTTATAMLATIGGNVNARRTGIAHVVFNLFTGFIAFILVPFYVRAWDMFVPVVLRDDPQVGLVFFHSIFNIAGVICVLPFTQSFASFVVWLVPAGKHVLERRLEPMLLSDPKVALASVRATLDQIISIVFLELASLLNSQRTPREFLAVLQESEQATKKTSEYLNRIQTREAGQPASQLQISSFHVIDHLSRLIVRAGKEDRLEIVARDPELIRWSEKLSSAIGLVQKTGLTVETAKAIESVWLELEQRSEPYRREVIEQTIHHGQSLESTLDRLDGVRWLRRIAYHAWRITFHIAMAGPFEKTAEEGTQNA